MIYKPTKLNASRILKYLESNPTVNQVVFYGRHMHTEPTARVVSAAHKAMSEEEQRRVLFVRVPPSATPQGYHTKAFKRFRIFVKKLKAGEETIRDTPIDVSRDIGIILSKFIKGSAGTNLRRVMDVDLPDFLHRELKKRGYSKGLVLLNSQRPAASRILTKGRVVVDISALHDAIMDKYWEPRVTSDFDLITHLHRHRPSLQVVNLHGTPSIDESHGNDVRYYTSRSGPDISSLAQSFGLSGQTVPTSRYFGHLVELNVRSRLPPKLRPGNTLLAALSQGSQSERSQFHSDYLRGEDSFFVPNALAQARFINAFLRRLREQA